MFQFRKVSVLLPMLLRLGRLVTLVSPNAHLRLLGELMPSIKFVLYSRNTHYGLATQSTKSSSGAKNWV